MDEEGRIKIFKKIKIKKKTLPAATHWRTYLLTCIHGFEALCMHYSRSYTVGSPALASPRCTLLHLTDYILRTSPTSSVQTPAARFSYRSSITPLVSFHCKLMYVPFAYTKHITDGTATKELYLSL